MNTNIITSHTTVEDEISDLLNKGKRKLAINKIAQVSIEETAVEKSLGFAILARRAGLPNLSLSFLDKLDAEKVETKIHRAYALLSLGAINETLSIVQPLLSQNILAYFLCGAAYCVTWKHQKAIPLLEKFKENSSGSEELFLANSYLLKSYRIMGEFENAKKVALELPLGDEERAITELVIQSFSTTPPTNALDRLKEFRMRARIESNYEREREIEFYIGILTKDLSILAKLYYGTPSVEFRTRLESAYADSFTIPEAVAYGGGDSIEVGFDLRKGVDTTSENIKLKVSQKLHLTLVSLCSNFYGFIPLAQIAEKVLQQEPYNQIHTPPRIHQLIKRIKQWAQAFQLPIKVVESNGGYQLETDENYNIIISRALLEEEATPKLLARLTVLIPQEEFNISDAAKALGLSKRFARKILKQAEIQGYLKMKGSGRKTRYEYLR